VPTRFVSTSSKKRSPSPGPFGPPTPLFATSACTGPFASAAAANAASTAAASRMSTPCTNAPPISAAVPASASSAAAEQAQPRAVTREPQRDRLADPAPRDDDVPALHRPERRQ